LCRAQACGTPVIASRGGGASKIFSHRITGYLVAPGDSQEIATAIREILEDRPKAAAISEQGRKDGRRRFSKESVLNAMGRIIEGVALPGNGVGAS